MFSDPQVYQKLAANPKTSAFLADPVFRAKLERIQKDPNSIATEMMDRGDPRIMTAMGVILGIDVDFASAGAGDAAGSFGAGDAEEDVSMPDPRPAGSDRAQTTAQPSASARSPPQPEPEDDEAKAKREAKQRAEEEKKLGAESYKKRDFDAAVEHFANAWDTHKDITYMNNVGAAKFEKGDYEGAIKACEESVEYGREVLADFKLIAK